MPRIITPTTPEHEIDQQKARMFGTPKERLDFYRREIQYETTILANRTDAYLAAQSFLVIAFGSSMGNLNQGWGEMFTLMVPAFLALLGVLSSLNAWPGIRALNAWPGIRAAFRIIEHWQLKQSHLPMMGLAYDESPLFCEAETSQAGHRKSLLFSLRTPWIFLGFWVLLGTYSVYIQLA